MLHWILGQFSGRPPSERLFWQHWRKRAKAQHNDLPMAGYYPVSEEALEASNRRYLDPGHRSLQFAAFNLSNQRMIFPVRALYATGATLTISSNQTPANPSLAIEGACQFRLAAMEAALNSTPNELLILLSDATFPSAHSWEQSLEWREKEFPAELVSSYHSSYRHAAALFIKRIDTPEADFLAFKEAATVLQNCGLFRTETCENSAAEVRLGHVISDVFPSLRSREGELLDCKSRLKWQAEDPADRNVSETKIRANIHM